MGRRGRHPLQLQIFIRTVGAHSVRPFRFSGHLYGRMISAPTIIIFYLHSVGDGVPDVPLITEIAHGAARTPPPTITNFYPHRRGAFRAPISFSRTSARADDIRPYDYNFLSAFCRGRRPRRPVNYRNRPWGGEGATPYNYKFISSP